jgi:hypothetical protein
MDVGVGDGDDDDDDDRIKNNLHIYFVYFLMYS